MNIVGVDLSIKAVKRKRRRRFVQRTIRNGMVKVNGHYYKPDEDATQFDGLRPYFGLYWTGDDQQPYIFLWGLDEWPGPFCENGYFRWEWWRRQ